MAAQGFKKTQQTSINYLIAGVFLSYFFYQELPGTSVLLPNKPFSSSSWVIPGEVVGGVVKTNPSGLKIGSG